MKVQTPQRAWRDLPLIYFVRHGQTDWNAAQRLQGQSDIDLNDNGRGQAKRNGERLASLIDPAAFEFISSPMSRARETMEILRGELGLPRDGFAMDDRLKEVNFGDWQGFTYQELEKKFPGFAERRERDKWNVTPPNGESYRDLTARIEPWFRTVSRPTVCVSHGGVMRSIVHMVEENSDDAAAHQEIPQDRILRLENGRFDWM